MCLEKPTSGELLMGKEIDKDLSFNCNSPYKFARYDCILIRGFTFNIEFLSFEIDFFYYSGDLFVVLLPFV